MLQMNVRQRNLLGNDDMNWEGVPVTTMRNHTKKELGLKAYRPSFVSEINGVDMQKAGSRGRAA
jgi:hypothetical protein